MTPRSALIVATACCLLPVASARAAPPEAERQGRFIMQPVEGGFLRMDTETGAMSMCARKDGAFACAPVADERAAAREGERLAGENQQLRAEIRRLEEMLGLGDKPQGERHARRQPRFELPSEEDVDKAIGYIERMMKKFRDKLKDLDGSGSGKGTPL